MNGNTEFLYRLGELRGEGDPGAVEAFLLRSAESHHPDRGGDAVMYCAVLNETGSHYRGVGRYSESIEAFTALLAILKRLSGESSTDYATALGNLAGTFRLTGEHERSLELLRQARDIVAGHDDPLLMASMHNYEAMARIDMGRTAEAIQCLRAAEELLHLVPGAEMELATTHANLSAVLDRAGQFDEAETALRRAKGLYEKIGATKTPHFAALLNSLGLMARRRGDLAEAAADMERAAEVIEACLGRNIEYAIGKSNAAVIYEESGAASQAVACRQAAVEVFAELLGPDHERTRNAERELRRLRDGG